MKFPGIPENEEERLKSLYMMDLLDTRDDERFERLTRVAKKLFQVPVALISLLDRDRQWFAGLSGAQHPRDHARRVVLRACDFAGRAVYRE